MARFVIQLNVKPWHFLASKEWSNVDLWHLPKCQAMTSFSQQANVKCPALTFAQMSSHDLCKATSKCHISGSDICPHIKPWHLLANRQMSNGTLCHSPKCQAMTFASQQAMVKCRPLTFAQMSSHDISHPGGKCQMLGSDSDICPNVKPWHLLASTQILNLRLWHLPKCQAMTFAT
jgi:hypothetical protein